MSDLEEARAEALKQGYHIAEVSQEVLKGFEGMNPYAARPMGCPIDRHTILVDETDSDIKKAETIRHELTEMKWMRRGRTYWAAHNLATQAEERRECMNEKRKKYGMTEAGREKADKYRHPRPTITTHKPLWKDEWQAPRLKFVHFVWRLEVLSPGIAQLEIWQGARGYYVYYRRMDGTLDLCCGPYKKEETAQRKAENTKKALET